MCNHSIRGLFCMAIGILLLLLLFSFSSCDALHGSGRLTGDIDEEDEKERD